MLMMFWGSFLFWFIRSVHVSLMHTVSIRHQWEVFVYVVIYSSMHLLNLWKNLGTAWTNIYDFECDCNAHHDFKKTKFLYFVSKDCSVPTRTYLTRKKLKSELICWNWCVFFSLYFILLWYCDVAPLYSVINGSFCVLCTTPWMVLSVSCVQPFRIQHSLNNCLFSSTS